MTDERPSCAGKDFEHHERTEVTGELGYRWRCPACGDTGTFETTFAKLLALHSLLDRLQEQMLDRGVVFLLPSDATPGLFGQCFGRDVYRVPGIAAPLIALEAGQLDLRGAGAIAARLVFEIAPELRSPGEIRVAVRSACDRNTQKPA